MRARFSASTPDDFIFGRESERRLRGLPTMAVTWSSRALSGRSPPRADVLVLCGSTVLAAIGIAATAFHNGLAEAACEMLPTWAW